MLSIMSVFETGANFLPAAERHGPQPGLRVVLVAEPGRRVAGLRRKVDPRLRGLERPLLGTAVPSDIVTRPECQFSRLSKLTPNHLKMTLKFFLKRK